jgi:hypothetical protein
MTASPSTTRSGTAAIDSADSVSTGFCLAEILAQSETADSADAGITRIHGVLVGRFVAATETGEPLVEYPGNPGHQPLPALSTVPLSSADLDQPVVLLFERGDPQRPIILGVLSKSPASSVANLPTESPKAYRVQADQQRLVLSANREIVLQCGEASITLTSAGKVLLRGVYISSRSSGVNRVKGASVQIN